MSSIARSYVAGVAIMPARFVRPATSLVLSRGISNEARLEKAGLPVPPKKAASAYTYFVQEHFKAHGDEYKQQGGGKLDLGSVASAVANAWKNLSSSDRARFDKLAAEDRVRSERENDAFKQQLKKGQIAEIEAITKKKVRGFGKSSKSPEDKKPLSAFFLFTAELRQQQQGQVGRDRSSQTTFAKEAGDKWKALSDADKQQYTQQAEKLREAFKAKSV